MAAAKTIRTLCAVSAAILLIYAGTADANPLNGYYQIVTLTYVQDDDGRQRGFNNTGLYISATGSRIRVVGAWRGYPIAHTLAVDGNIGDTLVLKDTDNMSALYKFRIKNNTISGRHRVLFDDGTSHVIDAKATIRQLNQNEVDRLRSVINF
ncbi:MAG: hypothetical protein FWC23_05770 [Chitinispirillia bacterium]|nr:hypothetical protein [Chitinispirillia bacterium]MCL2268675.1 hypothetical protein [Chitinispirillia bacterium]